MIKNIIRLEHVVGDKIFHFTCDNDSPIANIKDALIQFMKCIVEVEDNIKSQQAAQQEKAAQDEPKEA